MEKERTIDLTRICMVLDNISEVEYEVAVKREEDLWLTHRAMRDRILFLENCGIVTKDESAKMLDWAEHEYKLNIKKVEEIEAKRNSKNFVMLGFDK